MNIKSPLIVFLVILTFFSCKKGSNGLEDTYIGGQIANPTSEYVIISKNDVILDTLYLNKNNKFGGKLKNIEAGLYVFRHPPENQVMYLEPGDSTLIWVNTLAFDESINFSGKGADKSNFITNIYLLNQKNNDLILSYYKVEPYEFARKTDSIREMRLQELDKLKLKREFSEEFYQLAKTSIDYEYYDLRERYALLIHKYQREYIDKIPIDFNEYRKNINFNDEQFQDYYVYLNLIDDYIRAVSVEYCNGKNISGDSCSNLISLDNIKRRILMTDSLIQIKNIKNPFLERLAAQGIIFSNSLEEIISILELLEEINYEGNALPDLKQMAGIQGSLLPGNNIGELELVHTNGEVVQLKNISKKPIITFHWSLSESGHYRLAHKIIKDLRFKYPEINFIGINVDKDQTEIWKQITTNNSYDPEFEYKPVMIRVKEGLLKNYLNKMIFMDPSGTIIKGDIQLNAPDLETSILEFISQ
ncbi:MAG: TlpA family protein disulfide reductase [Bacteroidota bacterium]